MCHHLFTICSNLEIPYILAIRNSRNHSGRYFFKIGYVGAGPRSLGYCPPAVIWWLAGNQPWQTIEIADNFLH